jgi:RimJ/RimL family protein N-acetyltransferase
VTIVGKKTRLRAIERSDIPTFVHWLNDPEVTQYLAMYMPMSQAQEERWFEAQLEKRDGFILGIETFDGKLIGNLGLVNVDWKNSQALLGIVIGEKEYWNHGYGADAITALLGFAFKQMNLHRVHLATYEYNERAIKCYQKCGFKLEGRMRQAHFYGGRYHDELVMGILREEFLGK